MGEEVVSMMEEELDGCLEEESGKGGGVEFGLGTVPGVEMLEKHCQRRWRLGGVRLVTFVTEVLWSVSRW